MQVGGAGGIPSDVTAVSANVTVTNTTDPSFLTVFPGGAALPMASDLNWVTGQTAFNLTVVRVGAGGTLTVFNAIGQTDVIMDVAGYYQ